MSWVFPALFHNGEYENEYLRIVCYKKGTTHIHFKRMDLLEKLNFFVAKEKMWLPSDEDLGKSKEAVNVYRDIETIIFEESEPPARGEIFLCLPSFV
jgi:hypothetical protein